MPLPNATFEEPCPVCELGPAGPCPACNGRGVVDYDDGPDAVAPPRAA